VVFEMDIGRVNAAGAVHQKTLQFEFGRIDVLVNDVDGAVRVEVTRRNQEVSGSDVRLNTPVGASHNGSSFKPWSCTMLSNGYARND